MMNISTKNCETLLPFLVVEAISAQDASFSTKSVRMMDKGWAWLVSGRKLLVWKFKDFKQATKTRRMLTPCFELQMPQSDLVHRADLIQVFFMPQNPNTSLRATTVPAALAVSPEGTVRFWSNIASERHIDATVVNMQGQEFCTLAPLSTLEFLLGTTTGSVYLLTIDVMAHDPRNALVCTALATPAGLLTGFSRRVTNLFFGPMASDVDSDTRRPLLAVPKYSESTIEKTGSKNRPFFVMSSSLKLRHWARTNEGSHSTNQLVREWDLHRNIHLNLLSNLGLSESDNINFWPIDMITTKSKELLILLVTLDSYRNNAINYATCIFNPYQASDNISKLNILRSHSLSYSGGSEEQLLALRFLERRATSPTCFVYDRKFLFLVNVEQDILDAIDYANQNDGILGSGVVDNQSILFTQRDGLVYIMPVASNKSRMDCMNETSMQLEPTMHSIVHEASSSKVDPMIVENENEVSENRENQHVDSAPSMSTRARDRSQLNQSMNKSDANKSADKSQTTKRKPDVLKENKEFEWIQQIEDKQYDLASVTLNKLAEESEVLKDRRETLLALSKLAKLAE